jgi:Baseplate J-like protein
MGDLIPVPDLDLRNEEQLAAQAIARTSGGLTVEIIDAQIAARQALRVMVAAGGLADPLCPELTNANPSSPHVVLLEAQAWLLAQIARRINQIPVRDQIEFARLFGIELRPSEAATTTLTFTVAPPVGVDVTIPALTQVSTEDGSIVFETAVELVIPYGQASGDVAAQNTVAGAFLLAPDKLTRQIDPVAYVTSVTNAAAIDSGADTETVDMALQRARNFQRRAERLVSTQDIEQAVLEEALNNNGIVRAFPFVVSGQFNTRQAGHTTLVVMTTSGAAVSAEVKLATSALLEQLIGNQFVYVIDPRYVAFDVHAQVRLLGVAPQTATLAAVERSLRTFYAAGRANFGRDILRAEIIAVIESTPGIDRIVSPPTGPILAAPTADVRLNPWELPQLNNVTLDVE